MNSLFRRIRMKLLDENKTYKYFKYAIGETLLIIIGILIAVQISNWNDERKAQAEFEFYVSQLKEDVRTAIKTLKGAAVFTEKTESQQNRAIKLLKQSEHNSKERMELDRVIATFGKYREPFLNFGFLGQLMSGEIGVINRDRDLTLKALNMLSVINSRLSALVHIESQIDMASANLTRFVGQPNPREEILVNYDLEELKHSEEYMNTAQHIAFKTGFVGISTRFIVEILEDFLTVLEEYE